MKKIKLIITGGGTGGHIYPGVSVARAVLQKHPDAEILFVGSLYGLESKIIPRENFILKTLPIRPFNQVGFLQKILVLFSIPISFLKSLWILWNYKPSAVLGVGGYASAPFLMATGFFKYFLKIRTAIWEGNAYPGLVNRILSRWVDTSFMVFQNSEYHLFSKHKIVSGLPVRGNMAAKPRVKSAQFHILIFGGSQGARGINNTVSEAIVQEAQKYPQFKGSVLENVKLVHQTGKLDFAEISGKYKNLSELVEVHEFLYDMNDRLVAADLVFCRAGASTIAELAACRRAAVLIPFPFAADNHQQKNAEVVAQAKAGMMILQKDFTSEIFLLTVKQMKENSQQIADFEKNIARLDHPQAAETIAAYLVGS